MTDGELRRVAGAACRRKTCRRFVLLAMAFLPLVAAGACLGRQAYERRRREAEYDAHRIRHFPKDVTEFMGKRTIAILRGATRVEVQRLPPLVVDGVTDAATAGVGPRGRHGFHIRSQGREGAGRGP